LHATSPRPASPSPSCRRPTRWRSRPRRIEADVRFLADDLIEGREAGTRGFDLAALYVATQYRLIGLEPGGRGRLVVPAGAYGARCPGA
jgi:hypothetical protein